MHYANVFLANTTLGASTFGDGSFSIDNVPLGTYEIVVSMMGYELEAREIQLKKPFDKEFNFKLKLKPFQAPKIDVTTPYPREWTIFHNRWVFSCALITHYSMDFKKIKSKEHLMKRNVCYMKKHSVFDRSFKHSQ